MNARCILRRLSSALFFASLLCSCLKQPQTAAHRADGPPPPPPHHLGTGLDPSDPDPHPEGTGDEAGPAPAPPSNVAQPAAPTEPTGGAPLAPTSH